MVQLGCASDGGWGNVNGNYHHVISYKSRKSGTKLKNTTNSLQWYVMDKYRCNTYGVTSLRIAKSEQNLNKYYAVLRKISHVV